MATIRFARMPGNTDLPLPAYATPGAAGMDLRAFLPEGPVTFHQGQMQMISTGFSVELPPGTEMQIRPRSGLALKQGLIIPNSPGTVDEDYRGCIMVGLYLLAATPVTLRHGDRIAQAVIATVARFDLEEVETLSSTQRGTGGFGSTGLA